MTVLVLLDHHEVAGAPALRPAVAELLTAARALAGGDPVHGVWAAPTPEAVPAAVLAELGAHGVARLHVLRSEADVRLSPVVAAGVADLVAATGARVVLAAATFEATEVAARVAVVTGAGLITDATSLELTEGRVVAGKSVFAGSWTTRCAVTAPVAVVTVKQHAVEATVAPTATAVEVVDHEVTAAESVRRVEVVERSERAASDRPDLAGAQVVVVGGRGVEGDFGPLVELADLLGGAVGATRVATDEGWIGHDAQIGQTGVTVSPALYIGAGVSGAVHHRGGMQTSGTIVAINDDPDAPIFEIADYGVVGDLHTVVPQLTAELRRLRG